MNRNETSDIRLPPPHGGVLRPLLVEESQRTEERRRAKGLRAVRLSSRESGDVIMLGIGAFSPLRGFMGCADYRQVVEDLHLADGTLWPMPITLSVPPDEAPREGEEIALVDGESGEVMGSMQVEECFRRDRRWEARRVFGTEDAAHPGVARLLAESDILMGGPVRVFSEGDYPLRFAEYYARPWETRALFVERGWRTVAAFQTRNPIHRSHEYCTKIALEICDGLFLHPLVGRLKDDDIPAEVRMRCYEVLLRNYYPEDRVVCRVYPMEMRYAGPREALLHAVFRQNYGCTHLIVGRDHAGVGRYYGPFDAQKIFDRLRPGELHIQPLKLDWTFWCRVCNGMASTRTCPHQPADRVLISGTDLRAMLATGRRPPPEFTRPEVAEILAEYYRSLSKREGTPAAGGA